MQLIVQMSKFLKICSEKGGKQDVSRGILLLQWFKKAGIKIKKNSPSQFVSNSLIFSQDFSDKTTATSNNLQVRHKAVKYNLFIS